MVISILLCSALFLASLTFFYEGYMQSKRNDNALAVTMSLFKKASLIDNMKFTPEQYVEILRSGYHIEYVNSSIEGKHDYWRIGNNEDEAILVTFLEDETETKHTIEEFKEIMASNVDYVVVSQDYDVIIPGDTIIK